MTKTTAFLFAASMLFLTTACDTADEPTTNDRAAEFENDADVDAPDGHHGKHGDRAKFMVDKLCSDLECTDAQTKQIADLFAAQHEDKDDGDREAHKAARAEANKLLAAAFRADTFDASVLDRAKPDHEGDHAERMIEFAVGLHAILTPEQRAKLADEVQDGGPMFFMGRHGKRGHGPEGEGPHGDPSSRITEHVNQLCALVTCTPEQQTQLTQTLTSAHEARRAAHESEKGDGPDFTAVAALLRADTLDTAKLRATLDAGKAEHEQRRAEHGKAFGETIAAVHAILTPEQRAVVADQIEAKGMRALMGGKSFKHGKRDRD